MKAFPLWRWYIKGVEVIGKNKAIIHIRIPGVNQRDRVYVGLNIFDKLQGISIESKTDRVMRKWKMICKRKNEELDQADVLSSRLRYHLKNDGGISE